MSKLSIFDSAWTDMVFEGRNKDYGAYQLRKENPRTTIIALFTALALLGVALTIPNVVRYFNPQAIASIPDETVVLHEATDFVLPVEPPKPEPPKPAVKAAAPLTPEVPDTFREMQMTEKPTNTTPQNNTEAVPEGNPNGLINGTGLPTSNGTSTKADPIPAAPDSDGREILLEASLDVKPKFPGGMERFYKYVGNNFHAPEESSNAGASIKVFVSFVIEKDGTMTDIKVLRNPGYGMDKEAIRVLKSLKTKWEPGIYKGQKVRTAFTLPITVKTPD
ncbi:MAG: energy transducer TonB [Flavobacterium sp.]|nr:energy transducer TonB [Flavobacterium sp.]